MEVVKELLGLGESLVGRLLLYDALQARFSTLAYAWDPDNPLNGRAPASTICRITVRRWPMRAASNGLTNADENRHHGLLHRRRRARPA